MDVHDGWYAHDDLVREAIRLGWTPGVAPYNEVGLLLETGDLTQAHSLLQELAGLAEQFLKNLTQRG